MIVLCCTERYICCSLLQPMCVIYLYLRQSFFFINTMHLSAYRIYLTKFVDYFYHCMCRVIVKFSKTLGKCPKLRNIPHTQTTLYEIIVIWIYMHMCIQGNFNESGCQLQMSEHTALANSSHLKISGHLYEKQ